MYILLLGIIIIPALFRSQQLGINFVAIATYATAPPTMDESVSDHHQNFFFPNQKHHALEFLQQLKKTKNKQ